MTKQNIMNSLFAERIKEARLNEVNSFVIARLSCE